MVLLALAGVFAFWKGPAFIKIVFGKGERWRYLMRQKLVNNEVLSSDLDCDGKELVGSEAYDH